MGDVKSATTLIDQIIKENSENFAIVQLAEKAKGQILAK